jgi:hypothetical protein
MLVEQMESFPPNSNPFNHDLYNMGQSMGTNVVIMYGNGRENPMGYLIVVDKTTGERLKITFPVEKAVKDFSGASMFKV